MGQESEAWIIAQAYCGFITFIVNLIVLHLLIGNIQTAEHIISSKKNIVYLAMFVVISSLIYCLSSSIFLSDAIFPITITQRLCKFGFIWCYTWYTLQRYFVYLFFIIRLKICFDNTVFAVSFKCISILIVTVSIVMLSIEISWIALYKPCPAHFNGYNECTTFIDESDGSMDILIVSSLILIDILVAFTTLFYFTSKLYALRNHRKTGCCCCMKKHPLQKNQNDNICNNKHIKDDVKKIADRALIAGIVAIASTMSFYFGYFIIDSIGHILQIDSIINSLCIVAVFDWKIDSQFCYRYILWPFYLRFEKQLKNIQQSANADDTIRYKSNPKFVTNKSNTVQSEQITVPNEISNV